MLSLCTSFIESVVENSSYCRLSNQRPSRFVISKSMVFRIRLLTVDITISSRSFVLSQSRVEID